MSGVSLRGSSDGRSKRSNRSSHLFQHLLILLFPLRSVMRDFPFCFFFGLSQALRFLFVVAAEPSTR
eukprot:scaffold363_cov331-Pavlova_lutheri.AAC.82